MTLETIYYVGQTIAVGAILASLVAIYIQQRKDHAFAQAQCEREILQQTSHWFDDLLSHPTGLESIQSCLQNYHGATPRAQAEFSQYMLKSVTIAEQAVFMHEQKLMNYDSHLKLVMLPALHIVTRGGREYWEHTKAAFGEKVVAAIDAALKNDPPTIDMFNEIFPYFKHDSETAVLPTPATPGGAPDIGSTA